MRGLEKRQHAMRRRWSQGTAVNVPEAKREKKPMTPARKRVIEARPIMRSPLAVALNEWLQSNEGKKTTEPSILKSSTLQIYLENRIKTAFLAGVQAGKVLRED